MISKIILTFSLFATSCIQAQFVKAGIWQFSGGYARVKHANLETALKDPGRFGSGFLLNPSSPGLSAGYYTIKNKFLLGDNVSLSIISSNKWPEYGVRATTSVGFINLGYLLAQNNKCIAFIIGGLGQGVTRIKIQNSLNNSSLYLDEKNKIAPGESAKYTINNPAFEAAIGFKKTFSELKSGNYHSNSLFAGIDAGFTTLPFNTSWVRSGKHEKLSGFTKSSTFLWYIRASFGIITLLDNKHK